MMKEPVPAIRVISKSTTRLISVKTAEKAKKNTHVFTQRETNSTHVGAERRTSEFLPPVMRS